MDVPCPEEGNVQELLGEDLAIGSRDAHIRPEFPHLLQKPRIPCTGRGEHVQAPSLGCLSHGTGPGTPLPGCPLRGLRHNADHAVAVPEQVHYGNHATRRPQKHDPLLTHAAALLAKRPETLLRVDRRSEPHAPLCPAPAQNVAASGSCHAGTKPVLPFAHFVAWLERAFHLDLEGRFLDIVRPRSVSTGHTHPQPPKEKSWPAN